MEDYCKACITCKEEWSAGGTSCHDVCDIFMAWEANHNPVTVTRGETTYRVETYIPPAL